MNELPPLILSKFSEQVERADHLVGLVPARSLEWQPDAGALRLGDLLGHLLDCLAGVCAALYAMHPDRLAHFQQLRELPVNHCCGVEEARSRMRDYMEHIKEGFSLLTDADLSRKLPTVFNAGGTAGLTLLLNNLEHFINHKYQLFFYLKLLGMPVSTPDLYPISGPVS